MRMAIHGSMIWAIEVAQDSRLRRRISSLAPGDIIQLRVDGVVGSWEKMQNGANDGAAEGLKPTGPMPQVLTDWQKRRGEMVDVECADESSDDLDALSRTLSEWTSAEDEAAYGKLQAL